jgi:hypothetical protein
MRKQVIRLNSNASSDNHNTWACSLCYPFALEIGRVYGAGSLIYMVPHKLDAYTPEKYENGSYALLQGQGHRSDEIAFIKEKPTIKFYKNSKVPEILPYFIEMNGRDSVDLFKLYLKEKFINTDFTGGDFETFLIIKLARLINAFEKKYGNVEQYYKTFVKQRVKWVIKNRKESKP